MLKPGDVVRVKGQSAAPLMTVEKITDPATAAIKATCIWWFGGTYSMQTFHVAALEVVNA